MDFVEDFVRPGSEDGIHLELGAQLSPHGGDRTGSAPENMQRYPLDSVRCQLNWIGPKPEAEYGLSGASPRSSGAAKARNRTQTDCRGPPAWSAGQIGNQ